MNKSKLNNNMYTKTLFFCIQTYMCAKPKRFTTLVTKLLTAITLEQ